MNNSELKVPKKRGRKSNAQKAAEAEAEAAAVADVAPDTSNPPATAGVPVVQFQRTQCPTCDNHNCVNTYGKVKTPTGFKRYHKCKKCGRCFQSLENVNPIQTR